MLEVFIGPVSVPCGLDLFNMHAVAGPGSDLLVYTKQLASPTRNPLVMQGMLYKLFVEVFYSGGICCIKVYHCMRLCIPAP